MKKVMLIFGTRPEAIKMAPLIKELEKEQQFKPIVAVTAQHREMLDQVLELFKIKPDYDLNIMQTEQTLYDLTARALLGLQSVLADAQPDLILVHGDTTTTFVGALAAFYRQIPIAHVEAGLRTGNKYSPFPEEMNRRLTGAVVDWHFAPTFTSKQNLLQEGIKEECIFVTGNTVIDALLQTVRKDYQFSIPSLNVLSKENRRILLVTTHRRENLGEPLRQVYCALRQVIEEFDDIEVVFPVHKNPAVRRTVNEILGGMSRVHLIEPLDYEPFVNIMDRSYIVLTDSGGLQEEAPSLGKPVLVLRNTTERPEAVQAGTVRLVGTEKENIYQGLKQLLTDKQFYQSMANAVNPYGDGEASSRIVKALKYIFGFSKVRPVQYGYIQNNS